MNLLFTPGCLRPFRQIRGIVLLIPVAVVAQTPDVFTYNSGFSGGGAIPDANLTGWSDTRTVSGLSYTSITDIKVNLEISGGWAGDFYAYLSNGTGTSILLNRVGVTASDAFGYSDSGLNLAFFDGAGYGDIHLYQNVSGYASLINSGAEFAPDARGASPVSVLDTDSRTQFLSTFVGTNPNATWTLFIADLGSGNTGTVTSWGLVFMGTTPGPAPIPEMASPAWLVGLMAAGSLWRRRRQYRATRTHSETRRREGKTGRRLSWGRGGTDGRSSEPFEVECPSVSAVVLKGTGRYRTHLRQRTPPLGSHLNRRALSQPGATTESCTAMIGSKFPWQGPNAWEIEMGTSGTSSLP